MDYNTYKMIDNLDQRITNLEQIMIHLGFVKVASEDPQANKPVKTGLRKEPKEKE